MQLHMGLAASHSLPHVNVGCWGLIGVAACNQPTLRDWAPGGIMFCGTLHTPMPGGPQVHMKLYEAFETMHDILQVLTFANIYVMCNAGAHGVCGILLTMMQCYPELQELYPHQAPSLLAGSVAGLLSQTLPSGNLLSSLGSESDK